MSEAKYTAGPWAIDATTLDTLTIETGELVIATVQVIPDYPETGEANAKLIAAAPNLLEALQASLELADKNYNEQFNGRRTDECQKIYDQCKTAILKATE